MRTLCLPVRHTQSHRDATYFTSVSTPYAVVSIVVKASPHPPRWVSASSGGSRAVSYCRISRKTDSTVSVRSQSSQPSWSQTRGETRNHDRGFEGPAGG